MVLFWMKLRELKILLSSHEQFGKRKKHLTSSILILNHPFVKPLIFHINRFNSFISFRFVIYWGFFFLKSKKRRKLRKDQSSLIPGNLPPGLNLMPSGHIRDAPKSWRRRRGRRRIAEEVQWLQRKCTREWSGRGVSIHVRLSLSPSLCCASRCYFTQGMPLVRCKKTLPKHLLGVVVHSIVGF
jgi:hypothetical protein